MEATAILWLFLLESEMFLREKTSGSLTDFDLIPTISWTLPMWAVNTQSMDVIVYDTNGQYCKKN